MMNKPAFYKVFIVFLLLTSCVSVPPKNLMVSQRDGNSAVHDARDCAIDYKNIPPPDSVQKQELDSGEFRVMDWNIFKGIKQGWKEDFEKLTASYDIITLQEARLTDDLRELLKKGGYTWDISVAFKFNGAETGVLTASSATPDSTCSFRTKEPVINLPKSVMVTTYGISGSDKTLMVVNVHSVNFSFGTGNFKKQLRKVEDIVSHHKGPVILSGDFNTWSGKRTAILKDLSERSGLKEVTFNKSGRTRIFGHATDHMYYRGLNVIDAKIIKVNSSDHNPMMVSFSVEDP